MRITEAFSMFEKAELVATGLSEKTIENYRMAINAFVSFFGDKNIRFVSNRCIDEFRAHALQSVSMATARGWLICLRAIFRWLERKKMARVNPDEIKIPKRPKTAVRYLNREEAHAFIEAVGESRKGYSRLLRKRNVLAVTMLYECGLRVSELCALDRDSICDRKFVVVGKSANPRQCFISEKTEKLLVGYLDERKDCARPLFISQSGKRLCPQALRGMFHRVCEEFGFENIHPHTLRHSCATTMLNSGVDIRYIAEFLGHGNLDTTKIYTHVAGNELQSVWKKVKF